jgi:hypothetical protein
MIDSPQILWLSLKGPALLGTDSPLETLARFTQLFFSFLMLRSSSAKLALSFNHLHKRQMPGDGY